MLMSAAYPVLELRPLPHFCHPMSNEHGTETKLSALGWNGLWGVAPFFVYKILTSSFCHTTFKNFSDFSFSPFKCGRIYSGDVNCWQYIVEKKTLKKLTINYCSFLVKAHTLAITDSENLKLSLTSFSDFNSFDTEVKFFPYEHSDC